MPRKPRIIQPGIVYHVMNRASARAEIFRKDADYAAFERTLADAVARLPMRLLTYTLMPNHFHLVLWPKQGQDLSDFMRWLQVTHTQRWHAHYHTSGTGHLYQGRFKAFPVQEAHVRKICRYVERNALRAKLCKHAEMWRWSGLWRRIHGTPEEQQFLSEWPRGTALGGKQWGEWVNEPQSPAELAALRESVRRGRPLGDKQWIATMARRLDLGHTLRDPGRPKKSIKKNDS